MDLGLKGKVAVISGGSVGIGLAVAEALAEEGVQLVLCARNEARCKAVATTFEVRESRAASIWNRAPSVCAMSAS